MNKLGNYYLRIMSVYIFVICCIHIFYSDYIAFSVHKNIGMMIFIFGSICSLVSMFYQKVILNFLNLFIWGSFVYIYPYIVNVGYPIITIQLIIIFISSLNIERDIYRKLIYVCIGFVVYQYVKMGWLKLMNPIWLSGDLLAHYATAEAGVFLLNQIISFELNLSRIISFSVIMIEISAIGLLFYKTRLYSLVILVLFHISAAGVFKIYEISFNYLLFYTLIYQIHNKEKLNIWKKQ
jgi:hypothetical protein